MRRPGQRAGVLPLGGGCAGGPPGGASGRRARRLTHVSRPRRLRALRRRARVAGAVRRRRRPASTTRSSSPRRSRNASATASPGGSRSSITSATRSPRFGPPTSDGAEVRSVTWPGGGCAGLVTTYADIDRGPGSADRERRPPRGRRTRAPAAAAVGGPRLGDTVEVRAGVTASPGVRRAWRPHLRAGCPASMPRPLNAGCRRCSSWRSPAGRSRAAPGSTSAVARARRCCRRVWQQRRRRAGCGATPRDLGMRGAGARPCRRGARVRCGAGSCRIGPRGAASTSSSTRIPTLSRVIAASADLVIDAILGTGLRSAPRDPQASAIRAINASGVSGPQRRCPERPRCHAPARRSTRTVRATLTCTLTAMKQGLRRGDAAAHAGAVWVADIGMPAAAWRQAGLDRPPGVTGGELVHTSS